MRSLDNDNVYPNSTEYFFGKEPEEQKKARTRSVEDTLAGIPLLKEVVAHVQDEIARLESLNSIQSDITSDPAVYQREAELNRAVASELRSQLVFIESRVKEVNESA